MNGVITSYSNLCPSIILITNFWWNFQSFITFLRFKVFLTRLCNVITFWLIPLTLQIVSWNADSLNLSKKFCFPFVRLNSVYGPQKIRIYKKKKKKFLYHKKSKYICMKHICITNCHGTWHNSITWKSLLYFSASQVNTSTIM